MSAFGFLIIIIAFAFLWLVLVRPQKRRQVELRRMLADLDVGDEVLTAGGIYGRVTAIVEDEVTVAIADGVEVRVARRAIAGVTPEELDDEDDEGPPETAPARPPTGEDGG